MAAESSLLAGMTQPLWAELRRDGPLHVAESGVVETRMSEAASSSPNSVRNRLSHNEFGYMYMKKYMGVGPLQQGGRCPPFDVGSG